MFYVVRMEKEDGRCCMTAEMASFQEMGYANKEQAIRSSGSCSRSIQENDSGCRIGGYFYGFGESLNDAWKNSLAEIQKSMEHYSYNGYQVRYFWFVKYDGDSEYVADSLRTIIATTPGVVALGEMRNANTYNTLDGYMVPFENTNGTDGEYDDDNW